MSAIADVLEGRARWALLNCDNAAELPYLADGAVGCTICDPPYDERTTANMRTRKGQRGWGKCKPIAASFEGLERYGFSLELLRVSKRWVVVFCALEQLGLYKAAVGEKQWVRAGVWRKHNPAPQFTGDRPGQGAEGVAIMHRPGRKRWNDGGAAAFWATNTERDMPEHPTPKPLDLMLAVVAQFTEPDEVVFDPFCGSGTTLVAALRLGRRAIGIEKDAKYAAVARERLQAESQGLTLRDARAGQLPMFPAEAK